MACKSLIIDGVKFVPVTEAAPQDDKVVLVRCKNAGVHVGELVKAEGELVILKNAHRVWRWKGANTLNELSQKGADMAYTRISEAVPEIILLDGCEIIRCSLEGAKSLRTPRWPS